MTKPSKPRSKKSGVSPATIPQQAQPHGGALRVGNPGNAGGTGRPPEALRISSREMFDALLAEVRRRYEAGELKSAELNELSALLNTFGKYGVGTQDTLTVVSPDVQARLQRQVEVITRLLPRELAESLLAALTEEVWTDG